MTRPSTTNLGRLSAEVDADKLQTLRSRYRAGMPVRYFVRPLLMAFLVMALLVGLLAVVVEVSGDERWFALTPLLFLIALEGIYTTNWLHNPRQMPLDRSAYRAAELFLLLVIVRGAIWIIFDEGVPDLDDLLQYLRAPQDLFLNIPFLITVVLAAITWYLAVTLSRIFNGLEVTEFELHFYSLPLATRKAHIDDQPIHQGRKELLESYLNYWLWGGVLLVFAAGISTLEQQSAEAFLAPLAAGRTNLDPRVLTALLLYFIVGLWLLSQSRLMHNNARWLVNSVSTDIGTQKTWQRSSLVLLVLVVVVAAFVPIGSTSALSQIVGVILFWLLFLANILIFLVMLPFALLLALLSGGESGPPERFQPPDPAAMIPPQQGGGASAFSETVAMIFSSGFWAIFVVIVVAALLFFLRERRQGHGGLNSAGLWQQATAWLRSLWLMIRGQARSIQQSLAAVLEPEVAPPPETGGQSRWRFIRVRGLSPRDQIRYFYLSAVRRAGDRGVKRPQADTPSEYLEELKENWPEAEEALDELTDAFLEARYSDEAIDEEDIPQVKATWKNVRRKLRERSSRPAKDEDEVERD